MPGVYNVRAGRVEATQSLSRQDFAHQVFTQLQRAGHIRRNARFADYRAAIESVIQDQDNDSYLDMSSADLARALEGMPGFGERISVDQLEATIAGADHLDAYFDDSVSLSSQAQEPAASPLANMSLAQALNYFRTNYGRIERWSPEARANLVRDFNAYITAHFVDMPMDSATAVNGGGVNDNFNNRITDQTLAEFSRDRQGRIRVDCGIYAAVAGHIFQASGLDVRYGYVAFVEEEQSAGHIFAVGLGEGSSFIANNGRLTPVASDVPAEVERAAILEMRRLGNPTRPVYSDSPQEARAAAMSETNPVTLTYAQLYYDLAGNALGRPLIWWG